MKLYLGSSLMDFVATESQGSNLVEYILGVNFNDYENFVNFNDRVLRFSAPRLTSPRKKFHPPLYHRAAAILNYRFRSRK